MRPRRLAPWCVSVFLTSALVVAGWAETTAGTVTLSGAERVNVPCACAAATGPKDRIVTDSAPRVPSSEFPVPRVLYRPAPSVWSVYAFNAIPVLLVLAFLLPVIWRDHRRGWKALLTLEAARPMLAVTRPMPLWLRGVAGLMACIFLIGFEPLQALADESQLYRQVSTSTWGEAGEAVSYGYDDNGSLIHETRTNAGAVTRDVVNVYNLENRLAESTVTRIVAGTTNVTHCAFGYNHEGIRASKVTRTTVDGVPEGVTTNLYLLDSFNATGYAQVLEEKPAADAAPTVSYTIGDDVTAQTRAASDGLPAATDHMLHDGHGSTRALADATGAVTARYGFDAYGVMLGSVAGAQAKQATSSLYCGEQFDSDAQQYYLRARYYDQQNGRFSVLDPFAGSPEDPQSLHKYAYCGADPVNAVDPSGTISLLQFQISIAIGFTILGMVVGGIVNGVRGAIVGALVGLVIGTITAYFWGVELFLWGAMMWERMAYWIQGLSVNSSQWLVGPYGRVSLQRLQELHSTTRITLYSRLSGSLDASRGLCASTSQALADAGGRAARRLYEFNVPQGVLFELQRIGAVVIKHTTETLTKGLSEREYEFTELGVSYIVQFMKR